MKEEALKEFVDNVIQERMQSAFSQMKAGKKTDDEDDVEQKYEEAVALMPEDKQQAVRAYCDAIFDSGADAEQFFYRLGLSDGLCLKKLVKKILLSLCYSESDIYRFFSWHGRCNFIEVFKKEELCYNFNVWR